MTVGPGGPCRPVCPLPLPRQVRHADPPQVPADDLRCGVARCPEPAVDAGVGTRHQLRHVAPDRPVYRLDNLQQRDVLCRPGQPEAAIRALEGRPLGEIVSPPLGGGPSGAWFTRCVVARANGPRPHLSVRRKAVAAHPRRCLTCSHSCANSCSLSRESFSARSGQALLKCPTRASRKEATNRGGNTAEPHARPTAFHSSGLVSSRLFRCSKRMPTR
jgi:hypothetical protein